MTAEQHNRIKEGDEVYYAGDFYRVAEPSKEFPHGVMIGIYDEPPTKHIDYLNPESVNEVLPCPECQGQGCPTCNGYGRIVN